MDEDRHTPTLELMGDALREGRRLFAAEADLMRSEIKQGVLVASSGLTKLAAGAALAFAALIIFAAAAGAFLVRLGVPIDLACLIVAAATAVAALLLLRAGARSLQSGALLPRRSLMQITSFFGRL